MFTRRLSEHRQRPSSPIWAMDNGCHEFTTLAMIGRLPQVLPTPSAAYSLPPSFFEVPFPTSTCLAELSPFELCPSVLNTLGRFSSALSSLLLIEPFVRGRSCYFQCQEINARHPLCWRANTAARQMTPENASRFTRRAYFPKPQRPRFWFKEVGIFGFLRPCCPNGPQYGSAT